MIGEKCMHFRAVKNAQDRNDSETFQIQHSNIADGEAFAVPASGQHRTYVRNRCFTLSSKLIPFKATYNRRGTTIEHKSYRGVEELEG